MHQHVSCYNRWITASSKRITFSQLNSPPPRSLLMFSWEKKNRCLFQRRREETVCFLGKPSALDTFVRPSTDCTIMPTVANVPSWLRVEILYLIQTSFSVSASAAVIIDFLAQTAPICTSADAQMCKNFNLNGHKSHHSVSALCSLRIDGTIYTHWLELCIFKYDQMKLGKDMSLIVALKLSFWI